MVEDLFAIDIRSLQLLRVSLGSLLLVDLCMRARNLRAHYTDAGVFPRAAAIEIAGGQTGRWSLHFLGGSLGFAALMFFVAGIFALMLLVGYQTRLATVASWVLLMSLQARMPAILNGSDTLLRLLLFWSMFLPFDRGSAPSRLVSIGSAALLVQVATLYFVAGCAKVNQVWLKGDGLFYALSHFGTSLGRRLLAWPTVLRTVSKAVPWLEIAGALLLFFPFRTPEVRLAVVVVFIALHVGIWLFMKNLGLFPLTCMVACTIFLPTFAWDKATSLAGVSLSGAVPVLTALGSVGSSDGPFGELPLGANILLRGVVLLLLLLLTYATVSSLDLFRRVVRRVFGRRGLVVKARLDRIVRAGLLRQNWKFFGSPTRARAWFVFQMNLADGRSVDMLSGKAPRFDEASRHAAERQLVTDHHWWDYFMSLARPGAPHMKYTLAYYRREWNASHPPSEQARSIVVHMALQRTYPVSHEIAWERNKLSEGADVPDAAPQTAGSGSGVARKLSPPLKQAGSV